MDGAQRRIPSEPCHSEMIPTTEEEAVVITGICIAMSCWTHNGKETYKDL